MSKRIKKPARLSREQLLEKLGELLPLFQAESERGSALLAGALLDDVLVERLREFFVPDTDRVESVFGQNGPLGSFSARITMGYLVGLYGPKTRETLDKIRDIRNTFAHVHEIAKFTDPEVSRVCLSLLPDWMEYAMEDRNHPACKEPRRRFQACVCFLIFYLLGRSPLHKQPTIGFDRFVYSTPE